MKETEGLNESMAGITSAEHRHALACVEGKLAELMAKVDGLADLGASASSGPHDFHGGNSLSPHDTEFLLPRLLPPALAPIVSALVLCDFCDDFQGIFSRLRFPPTRVFLFLNRMLAGVHADCAGANPTPA